MTKLSITTAWNETVEFVKREGRLLFPIAFLFIALPGAILQAAMPTPAPGQTPEAGLWLILLPLAIVASMIGTLAIIHLAIRSGASVAEALQVGARRFLYVLGAVLLVAVGALLLAMPLLLLIGAGSAGGGPGAPLGAAAALLLLVLIAAYIFLWIRLMLMTAIGTVEPVGPIAMIVRSWRLTQGHFWKLLGFMLLVLLASLVVISAITFLAGIVILLLAGPPQPDSLSMYLLLVVSALLQAVVSTIFATLTARIYTQLSGFGTKSVFT